MLVIFNIMNGTKMAFNWQQGLTISHKQRSRENIRLSIQNKWKCTLCEFLTQHTQGWTSMFCHILDSRSLHEFLKGLDISFHKGEKKIYQKLLNSRISPLTQEVPELQFAESWEDLLGEYNDKVT